MVSILSVLLSLKKSGNLSLKSGQPDSLLCLISQNWI